MKENIIKTKSFEFAINSIEIYKLLLEKNEYIISKQFFRSATSIGANVEEADAGYSKKDFSAKMSIASKEAREAHYWLRIIEKLNLIEYSFKKIKSDCVELIRILTSIVKTSQESFNIKH